MPSVIESGPRAGGVGDRHGGKASEVQEVVVGNRVSRCAPNRTGTVDVFCLFGEYERTTGVVKIRC
jgi:hypothetical protein